MSNPLVSAAAPSLVSVLEAFQTFVTNLGPDPAKVAVTFPGAAQILIGSIELQAPVILAAEFGAAQSLVQARVASWIASVKALEAPATTAA